MIILDTNVISALMLEAPLVEVAEWLDRQPRSSIWTTAITVFELRTGVIVLPSGRRKTVLEERFRILMADRLENRILDFDRSSAEEAAALVAIRKHAGRPIDLRDAMIAGIALTHKATLATRNVRHFEDLSLPVINPWEA